MTGQSKYAHLSLSSAPNSLHERYKKINKCKVTEGATENAGLENAAPDCRGGKRGTGKRGTRLQGWKTRE